MKFKNNIIRINLFIKIFFILFLWWVLIYIYFGAFMSLKANLPSGRPRFCLKLLYRVWVPKTTISQFFRVWPHFDRALFVEKLVKKTDKSPKFPINNRKINSSIFSTMCHFRDNRHLKFWWYFKIFFIFTC